MERIGPITLGELVDQLQAAVVLLGADATVNVVASLEYSSQHSGAVRGIAGVYKAAPGNASKLSLEYYNPR